MSPPTPGQPMTLEPGRWVVVGSGFIGGSLSQLLAQNGHAVFQVHAPRLDLDTAATPADAVGQLRDPSVSDIIRSMAEVFAGASVVVNAAGLAMPDARPSKALSGANGLLPAVLLQAAADAGVSRFIHISSAVVQGRTSRLDETNQTSAISAYGASKILGEETLDILAHYASSTSVTRTVILRATSVQGARRGTTSQLERVARSRIASVAGQGTGRSPVSSVKGLARAVIELSRSYQQPPQIVLQPWEGETAYSVLSRYGGRTPTKLPVKLCRFTVDAAFFASKLLGGRYSGLIRRIEVMWFGQDQMDGWLTEQGANPQEFSGQLPIVPPTIIFGATAALTARVFMVDQCDYVARQGWFVHLVTGAGSERLPSATHDFIWHVIEMKRAISPAHDVRSLSSWLRLIRRLRPDAVMVGTPKAGLLGIVASFIYRVPLRIYLVRGLRSDGLTGFARLISLLAERLTCRLATHVVAVGPSLRRRMIEERLTSGRTVDIIGSGGSNGVDTDRFRPPTGQDRVERRVSRADLGVADHIVIGLVGRLTVGKGLAQALAAIRAVNADTDRARLLIVGEFEAEHAVPEHIVRRLEAVDIIRVGRVLDTAPYYRAMDIFIHPSHFEGLPNVILEASATGLPVITSDVTGCVDVVEHDRTGYIVGLYNHAELVDRISQLCDDEGLRQELGRQGRALVQTKFTNHIVRSNLVEYVNTRASEAGVSVPSPGQVTS